jgi:hypothetical protein
MKDMVGTTREMESNRLEVQLKLFAKKMQYQRDKDHQLYKQGRVAAENARLAIQKQGELVECLSKMSNVLHLGLMVSEDHHVHQEHAAPLIGANDVGTSDFVYQTDGAAAAEDTAP